LTGDEKERAAVKIVLLKHGWKVSDLARMTGRTPAMISNLLCGNDAYWPARAAVNKALGLPIFTKANLPRPAVRKTGRRHRRLPPPPPSPRARGAASPLPASNPMPAHAID
jgi:transcriptional regulator with XRE-family HTH domain